MEQVKTLLKELFQLSDTAALEEHVPVRARGAYNPINRFGDFG